MAMFLNRILKLHARRDNARFFSSLPEFPYLFLGGKKLRDSPEGQVGKHMFFDPTKEEKVYSSEKTVPQELNGQPLLGASQGWVACRENKEFTVHLTDMYKPWVSSPKVISLPSIEAWWEMLDKCFMSNHLGHLQPHSIFHSKIEFRVKCSNEDGEWIMMRITKRFTMFMQDKKRKEFCYTDDIGDLCIFLGQSEAFCLSASMYSGLKPNSIYYIGSGLRYYNLASGSFALEII
ncbi:hypothetical protein YC2023_015057 [Brassica napus]